jgi:hypothetical protein
VAFSDDFPATVGAMNAFLREAGLAPAPTDGAATAAGVTPR